MAHNVLLLRAQAHLQSWGRSSGEASVMFYTSDVPTKTGVLGMVAAALGIREEEPFGELASLVMGVRVDLPGEEVEDLQMMGGQRQNSRVDYRLVRSDGKGGGVLKKQKFYLADADFLIGLQHDDLELLRRIEQAVRTPRRPLFLGRSACIPSSPVWIPNGLLERDGLGRALTNYPWPRIGESSRLRRGVTLRTLYEVGSSKESDYGVWDAPTAVMPVGVQYRAGRSVREAPGMRYISERLLGVGGGEDLVPVRNEEDEFVA